MNIYDIRRDIEGHLEIDSSDQAVRAMLVEVEKAIALQRIADGIKKNRRVTP